MAGCGDSRMWEENTLVTVHPVTLWPDLESYLIIRNGHTRDFWKLLIRAAQIQLAPLLTNIHLVTEQPDSGYVWKLVPILPVFTDSMGFEHDIL